MANNLLINSSLFLSILFSGLPEEATLIKDADPCERIEIFVSVEDTNAAIATGKVKVDIKGAKEPILYFFSFSTGQMIDDNYKQNSKASLKSGKYVCTIKEAGGCRKRIEFEIK